MNYFPIILDKIRFMSAVDKKEEKGKQIFFRYHESTCEQAMFGDITVKALDAVDLNSNFHPLSDMNSS